MLQSNCKIKRVSMFLIASFFVSFLTGEVNANRGVEGHKDGKRVCRQRHRYHHHRRHGYHQRHNSYLHQHNRHRHHHHWRHKRDVKSPDAVISLLLKSLGLD